MDIDLDNLEIVNNADAKRFEIQLGDKVAMVEYMRSGNNIIYTHTEVPPEFEGKGIAGKLAHHVMEYAKNEGLKVQPLCPFINSYVKRHPEYQDISWGF